jgi:hypothetical protein
MPQANDKVQVCSMLRTRVWICVEEAVLLQTDKVATRLRSTTVGGLQACSAGGNTKEAHQQLPKGALDADLSKPTKDKCEGDGAGDSCAVHQS